MTDDLVTVATFATASEAEAAKVTLEAEGIRTLLTDSDWNALGVSAANLKLQVTAADALAATELLAGHGHTLASDMPDNDTVPEKIACLECGQPMPEGQAKCPACGWTYVA